MKAIPYSSATAGTKAQDEIRKILRRLGCDNIGIMDKDERHEVLLTFTHRNRPVQITVSAKGWAQLSLREKPYSNRCRRSRVDYEQNALKQGHIAVNSILRDWIKGQVTAIECGILSFEAAFMPYMLTNDGRPLVERIAETGLLAPPEPDKVVPLKLPAT